MAADIFANRLKISREIEESGRVKSTRRGEDHLLSAHFRAEAEQHRWGNSGIASRRCDTPADGVDRGLAAKPAARRNREVALQSLAQLFSRRVKDDIDDVRFRPSIAPADAANLIDFASRGDKSFREQKSGDQLFIMTGRAHRDREAASAEPNFERLFHGEVFLPLRENAGAPLESFARASSLVVRTTHDVKVAPSKSRCSSYGRDYDSTPTDQPGYRPQAFASARRDQIAWRLPLLRGGMQPKRLLQSRRGHRHRRGSGKPHQRRHAMPQRREHLSARLEPSSRDQGDVSRAAQRSLGAASAGLGDGSNRASGQSGARSRLHRTFSRGNGSQPSEDRRSPRRRNAQQRRQLPHQEALLRRTRNSVDREPSAHMT